MELSIVYTAPDSIALVEFEVGWASIEGLSDKSVKDPVVATVANELVVAYDESDEVNA